MGGGPMSYYNDKAGYDAKGMDYDLVACLEENSVGFGPDDISQVLAVREGANDEENWYWVLAMADGRHALLVGGCDYTGWD